MLCSIGLKTDRTIGKSSIRFKDLKQVKFDTTFAICDNASISQLVQALQINKNTIPAVQLNVISSYNEKRMPSNGVRFFAFDEIAYKSICKMIEIANNHKHYEPRIEVNDLVYDGDLVVIVNSDFLFKDSIPYDKLYVAINAESSLTDDVYLKYNPIFYYDSYALTQEDLKKIEIISARQFQHRDRVWYYDESHYNLASFIPESIENYKKLLEKANHPIVKCEDRYPVYSNNSELLFEALVDSGFKRKCPQTTEYIDRLEYEKRIIKQMHYQDYFVINWDFINWSREQSIPIGPGRGSAAGSLIAYCLDITKLDPIVNGLYFERFLNPERVSPPDIDTDIATEDRAKVIEYVKQKYGSNHVASIIAFTEIKGKSALKDAARLWEIDPTEINKVTSYFPPDKFGKTAPLDECYEVDAVKQWADSHKQIWDEAKTLEGYTRQTTVHPCGVIISPTPINETFGVSYDKENQPICQLYMADAEKFGLLKMDFLGLETLGILKKTQELLGLSYYDLEKIKTDDSNTIEAFAQAKTFGIFQFESDGMMSLLKRVKPNCFADIAASTALYRPGPIMSGLTEMFVHNKNSINPEYALPEFAELMSETYGVFVYQEQVMSVSQKICGFSLAKADNLRKAIGKKNKELMMTIEKEFVAGGVNNGYPIDKIQKLYNQILSFADYCFNKSHSYAYSLISYWAMYLKVNHPKEFAVAMLSSSMKDTSKLRSGFYALKDSVKFLPPFINEASENFSPTNDGVMLGFGSIKGMGNSATTLEANQPYGDILDVIIKNKLDTSQMTSLIYAGSFDKIEPNKSVLLGNLQRMFKFKKSNLGSEIYNIFEPSETFSLNYTKTALTPTDQAMEKSVYGYNIYHGFLGKNKWLIDSLQPGQIIGNIVDIKRTKTKKNQEDMAILTVECLYNKYKVVMFPNVYEKYGMQIAKEETYAFKGEIKSGINGDEEELSLLVKEMITEPAINVIDAFAYTKESIFKSDVIKALETCNIQKGICHLSVYDNDLGDNYIKIFDYHEDIKYDVAIHNALTKIGLEIKLNIF